jgi:hypothetical protein
MAGRPAAFLAGVATAQAAVAMASCPFDAAAICHGAGGPSTDRAPSDPELVRTLCCTFCGVASAASAPVGASHVTPPLQWGRVQPPAATPFIVSIARGAVRDGPSQAPPHLA